MIRVLVLFFFFLLSNFIVAQKISILQQYKQQGEIRELSISDELNTPSYIAFRENGALVSQSPRSVLANLFELPQQDLEPSKTTDIGNGLQVQRFQRKIDGIKVIHGFYNVLLKESKAISIFSEHYSEPRSSATPYMNAEEALQCVLPKLGSDMYAWESTAILLQNKKLTSNQRQRLLKVQKDEKPKGELVYVKDFINKGTALELAYLFMIESVSPEFRDRVYVSANDGRILLRDAQLKHGMGETRYSGTQTFPTTQLATQLFELKGTEPISGIFCETRSLEGKGGLPISSPAIIALSEAIQDGDEDDPCLTDMTETIAEFGDDEWDANEHVKVPFDGTLRTCCPTYVAGQCTEVKNDDIALDAQWGASTVARYWKDIHNRNGYDDDGSDLLSFVHHGEAYENASWNGLYMKYGDGSYQGGENNAANPLTLFGPLVSLDVCAHEIGHGICTSTSDLVYVGESGALNEGFSDIWAAAIEQYALDSIDGQLGFLPWGIAEQADERDMGAYNSATARALRWMDHPPAESNPDTYGAGIWWQDPDCASPNVANDFCGVHFNSGVLNKWFYLLTEGSGKAMSPGVGKPAFDDEVNDKGNSYSVNGIGMRKSEKITYGAELLLSPNSRFIDMRFASIAVARALYGPCSNEEEQTTRAWYAVGVGSDYGNCGPTIEFNYFNISQISEFSPEIGCAADTIINLQISSFSANATVSFTTSGNAVQGEDYDLVTSSIAFSGSENKSLAIQIYDDKVEEVNDTIIISFDTGVFADSDTIIIINDDGIPAVGSSAVLLDETFEVDDGTWSVELVNPTSMVSTWFVDGGNSDQAHVSIEGNSPTPTYNQSLESHVRLRSPLINAIGRRNVLVSFDWEAGGERDLVDTTALFDYGTFQISLDGLKWEKIADFVGTGTSGGQVSASGNFTYSDPGIDNQTFYLGYEWQNDALNGGSFSFKIDNVLASGEGLEIETEVNEEMTTGVPLGKRIGFISSSDSEVIAIIETSKSPLGCTEIKVAENDIANPQTESVCKLRGSKVFNMNSDLPSDSVQLTLFYTEQEVVGWVDVLSLNLLTVTGSDINNEDMGFKVIGNEKIDINDQRNGTNGYMTYTFWTATEYSSFSLTDRPSIPGNSMVMNNMDTGLLSLRDVVNQACPGDTIRFDIELAGDTIKLTSQEITLDRDLVIIGQGPDLTIITGGHNRSLYIGEDRNIQIEQLAIVKSEAAINGGAFYNKGTLMLKDVLLKNNTENGIEKALTNEGILIINGVLRVE